MKLTRIIEGEEFSEEREVVVSAVLDDIFVVCLGIGEGLEFQRASEKLDLFDYLLEYLLTVWHLSQRDKVRVSVL